MVKVGVERNGPGGFPLMVRSAEFSFEYLNYAHRNDRRSPKKLEYAGRRPDAVHSGRWTIRNSRTQRAVVLEGAGAARAGRPSAWKLCQFNDDEKRAYENRVVSFFLVRLPATAMAVR